MLTKITGGTGTAETTSADPRVRGRQGGGFTVRNNEPVIIGRAAQIRRIQAVTRTAVAGTKVAVSDTLIRGHLPVIGKWPGTTSERGAQRHRRVSPDWADRRKRGGRNRHGQAQEKHHVIRRIDRV